jgi:tRNA pseudouridine55 synthase
MRRALGERRVGHTGTLDPGATGVLPLVVGRATRLARFLSARNKTYEAAVRLGVATDTYDAEGEPDRAPHQGPLPSRDEIAGALGAFRGVFAQRPPAFSARRIGGRRSYDIARGARHDERPSPPAKTVTAYEIQLLDVEDDRVTLRVVCSAGFYVRSLAHELGERLGVGAHLTALRRTHSGDIGLACALPFHVAEQDPDAVRAAMVPVDRMLDAFRAIVLTDEGAHRATHGRDVGAADIVDGDPSDELAVRLMDGRGRLLAIAEPAVASGLLHPSVVLV